MFNLSKYMEDIVNLFFTLKGNHEYKEKEIKKKIKITQHYRAKKLLEFTLNFQLFKEQYLDRIFDFFLRYVMSNNFTSRNINLAIKIKQTLRNL